MQSLDSSCQEADFIINDTLKKLKGSSNSANANAGNAVPNLISNNPTAALLRQQQQIVFQHLPTSSPQQKFPSYHQLQTALQGTNVSTTAGGIRGDISTEAKSCLQNVVQTQQLSPPAPPTPPSLVSSSFSVSFPPKSSLIDNSLLHCNISQIPSQPPLCIFEDDEEPTNPTDQPPAELLAPTTSLSSLSNSARQSQNLGSALNFEDIVLLPQPAPPPSNAIGTSKSHNIPIVHQPNQVLQSTAYTNFNSITSPSPTVPDLLLSTSPGLQNTAPNINNYNNNNKGNNYNNNKKADKRPSPSTTTSGSSSTANHSVLLHHIHNFQHNHNTHLSTSSPGASGSPTSSPSKRQKVKDISLTKSSHSSALSRSISNAASSGFSTGQNITSNTLISSSSTISSSKKETSTHKFFNIHERIKDHYLQLLANDLNLFAETGIKQRTRSFILERIVECERLNTIVINLYPGNKGYALALYYDDRQIVIDTDLDFTTSPVASSSLSSSSLSLKNISSRGSNIMANSSCISSTKLCPSSIPPDLKQKVPYDQSLNVCEGSLNEVSSCVNDYSLVEVLRWPYENDQLLQCIDHEVIPDFLMDLLTATTITIQAPQDESTGSARIYAKPNIFYAGCVVAQIRDFRQTFATSTNICDTRHVLLRPTNATLFAEVHHIASTLNQTSVCAPEDKLALESQLVLATAEPLCLDPDPNIGRYAINSQYERQLFNTHELRRQMKKYTQISINRKRKLDQFTHHYGLELCDYLTRLRARPRSCVGLTPTVAANNSSSNANPLVSATMLTSFASKVPKRPRDVLRPIRPPRLDYPANLKVPDQLINVEKYAKTNERPRETTDCQPQLIEEYILETERDDNEGRRVVYHIKLSIFQRPSNSEYLGELYVDRDYREGIRNGESCRFPLGTRVHANRYIQQFTEIFTEEGRKAVKITHLVPGHLPKITHTGITPEQRQALLLQQQQMQLQQQHQQQQRQAALLAAQQQVIQQTITQSQPDQNQQQRLVVVGSNSQQQHLLPTTVQHLNTNTINSQSQTVQHVSKNINIVNVSGNNAAAVQHVLRQQQLQPAQQVTTAQFIDTNGATVQLQNSILSATTANNATNTTTNTNSISSCSHNIQLQQLSGSSSSTSGVAGLNSSGATTTHQLSLSNGSLVLVQQHPTSGSQALQQQQAAHALQHAGITIQSASSQQQQKTQAVTAQLNPGTNSSLRTQLSSNVPILQAQLKAAPIVTNMGQQQTQLLHKQNTANCSTNTSNITGNSGNSHCNTSTLQTNSAINAIVTSIMNSANQWQQQQQQNSATSSNASTSATSLKNSNNASILSLLNSAPAAMTSTPVASGTFTASTGQTQQQQHSSQQAVALVQQSLHPQSHQQQSQATTVVTTDHFIQSQVPNPSQRKQSEVLQNLLNPGRKINIVTSSTAGNGGTTATFRTNASGSLIAVNLNQTSNHQSQQRHHHHQQQQIHIHQQQQTQMQSDQQPQTTVRVSMSALASQLASPPAIMTNSTNFGGYTLSTVSGTGSNAGSIKILNSNVQQQRVLANALRRDSLTSSSQGPPNAIVVGVAAPSPGSDSNASNASGFAVPQAASSNAGNSSSSNALNALLANTATPSPSGSEHSQSSQNQNQSLLERLNSGGVTTSAPLPNMSPQQHHSSQQPYITKTLVQSPATSSIHSPMSSPHPQPSPSPHLPPLQQQQPPSQIQQQQSQTQTATLNLQGINFSTLQGAISNFSGLQNVQVQIPGFNQPISLQLTGGSLQAVQQPQQSGNQVSVVSAGINSNNGSSAAVSAQNNTLNQETHSHQRSLLVSVPVSSANQQGQTQHTITLQSQQLQQHHGTTTTGTIVNLPSGAIGTATGGSQAVVLSNNTSGGGVNTSVTNSSGNVSSNTGATMLTLPIAQLVGPGVQKLNSAALRTTSAVPASTGPSTTNANTAAASSIIVQPQSSQQQKSSNQAQQATITVSSTAAGNQTNQSIQLVGTIQQGGRNIQVVGTKQLVGGRQLITQRQIGGSTLKIAATAPINANSNTNLTSSANLTSNPIVMSTQKLQLKTIKTAPQHQAQQQQHQRILNQISASQSSHSTTQQQTQTQALILGQQTAQQQSSSSQHLQQQQHIQIQARSGSNLTQRTISAIAIAKQQQQQTAAAAAAAAAVAAASRRRPTTDASFN